MNSEKYIEISKNYEDSLGLKYKKENGIFYTDMDLAIKIIDYLDMPIDSHIIDPCCGTGNFLLAAEKRGFFNIYGADKDKQSIKICKRHTKSKNIQCMDTISNEGAYVLKKFKQTEKFDYILGNPPYVPIATNIQIDTEDCLFLRNVKDSGSNLFVASIYRALELVKKEGYVSYIIPKNFLHVSSYSLLRKKLLNEKRIVSIVDLGPFFKDVRGEQILLTIQNVDAVNNKISFLKYENKKFELKTSIDQIIYDDEILIFEKQKDFIIYKKLESSYSKFGDICTGYIGRGKSTENTAIAGKDLKKFGFKNQNVPTEGNLVFIQNIYSAESGIIASFAGNLEASQTVTIFTDGDEKMCRYVVGFLHSRLCNYYLLKFCFNNSKLTMHTDARYLKKLPLIINSNTFNKVIFLVKVLETTEYRSQIWFELLESLNESIYETYNINDEEKRHIESEMKTIQSSKWCNNE